MFFILSKILQFAISPIIWVLVLLIVSLLSKNEIFRRRSLITALSFTLFFSNSFVCDEFYRAWEIPTKSYSSLKKYDAGIVLGGMMVYDKTYDRIQFFRGSDRLFQAVELYKNGIIKKIVFTGGSGSILHPEAQEAPLVKRYLLTLGIPETDIILEGESRNTHENAEFGIQSKQYHDYEYNKEDEKIFKNYILKSKDRLDSLYSSLKNEKNERLKKQKKTILLTDIVRGVNLLTLHKKQVYFNFALQIFKEKNAFFMAFSRYDSQYEIFEKEFKEQYQSNLRNYLSYLKNKYPSL